MGKFKFLKKPWLIVLIVLAILIFIFAYQRNKAQSKSKANTYRAEKQTLREVLSFSGYVDAQEKVDLHFQSGGRLSWVGVSEGDRVEQYAGIAALDTRQLKKNIEKYLNNYDKQRRLFEQTNEDWEDETNNLSQEVRDRARRTLESAQFDLNNSVLDVELQTIAKEYSYLYTPISGIVTHMGAKNAGMNILPTDTFQVVNPETLYFSVSADQTEVINLHEGMEGKIALDSYPEKEIRGTISSISFTPKANETGTVYEVEMSFIPTENMQNYRLGMTGDAEFIIQEIQNAVSVPFSYVDEDEQGKNYVLKKVDEKPEKTLVEIGEEYDGQIQIIEGIYPGDTVYEIE